MDLSTSYARGFNKGYLIRKNHLLMKSLVNGATGDSQFLDGLKDGGKQYDREVNLKITQLKKEKIITHVKKDQGLEM
ncbi:MAG: hypothetical protein O2951_12600 [Bacteroidetes bacterium]|nr:hypothetical protein [Bacteroidota bacterium]